MIRVVVAFVIVFAISFDPAGARLHAQEKRAMLEHVFDAIRANDPDGLARLLDSDPALGGRRSGEGLSALSLAAYMERPALVEIVRERRGTPDFFEACIVGDASVVRDALASGQDVDALAPDGFTPLGLAVFFRNPEIARMLIDAGAGVDRRSANSQQVGPIHAAVARRDLPMLELLLSRGADPDAAQQDLFRPVHGAAASGQAAAVALLAFFGADLSARTGDGRSAADLARAGGHTALADRLDRTGRPS